MTRSANIALPVLLAAILLWSAFWTDRAARHVPEFPFGCDSYGYLRMARVIRGDGEFHFRYEQTRSAIAAFQSSGRPVESWSEIVAPHAHHYFSAADAVGPQYPPGTGLALSLFPEARALRGVNAFAVIGCLAIGMIAALRAARRQAQLAACCLTLASLYDFTVISGIGAETFSINAAIVPLVLAIHWTFAASLRTGWRGRAFAFAAGASMGFAVLARIPVVFLAPGLCVLLIPLDRRLRSWFGGPLALFALGVVLVGILPLLVHQQHVTGQWNRSTYGTNDTSAPSFGYFANNLNHYLRCGGYVALGHSVIGVLFGVFAVFAFRVRVPRRRLAAAAVIWLAPTAYFLTHRVTTDYYLIPSTIGTAWLIALSVREMKFETAPRISPFLAACVLGLGVFLAARIYWLAPAGAPPAFDPPQIPAELKEGKPWIWADSTSGTIEYYGQVPTFKLIFGDSPTRQFLYRHAFASGSPQFFVDDCPSMTELAKELRTLGAALEFRGWIAGFPYYFVQWPAGGPPVFSKD